MGLYSGNYINNEMIDRSGILRAIEIEHSRIHDGLAFETDVWIQLSGTTPTYLYLDVKNCCVHFKEVQATSNNSEVLLSLFRTPTVTLNGETQSPISNCNENFQDIILPRIDIFQINSVTSEGTLIAGTRKYLAGIEGQGNTSSGGSLSNNWEKVFKGNTKYLQKIQRLSGTGTTNVLLSYRWYESTPPINPVD